MQQEQAEANSLRGLHAGVFGRHSSDGTSALGTSHGNGDKPGVAGLERAPMESRAQEWPLRTSMKQNDFVGSSNICLTDWINRAQQECLFTDLPTGRVQELFDSGSLELRASKTGSQDATNVHPASTEPIRMDNLLGRQTSIGYVSGTIAGASSGQVAPAVARNYSHILDVQRVIPTHPNLFVRGFPLYWTENDLGAYFEAFGILTSVRIVRHNLAKTSLGYGFVRFQNPLESLNAIRALDGLKLEGNCLQVKSADSDAGPPKQGKPHQQTPSARCYVKHIPTSFTSSDLRGLFEFFGQVKEIKIFPCFDRYKGSSGIVQMVSLEAASNAIATLNGLKLSGSVCELVVRFAESKEEKDFRMGMTLLRNNQGGQNPVMDKLAQQLVQLSMEQKNSNK